MIALITSSDEMYDTLVSTCVLYQVETDNSVAYIVSVGTFSYHELTLVTVDGTHSVFRICEEVFGVTVSTTSTKVVINRFTELVV